ncbi:rhamnogalacturonan lyase [Aeoliella mucimassa]|uniref:Rhamnogalacturonan endolyase YesW n=1 Tax=Aeoliella mucimassa TaxID=2527972 RepID=A0A518ANC4_9BACT|nr:rhamnogalacturonan lyase [Aeoliella mucimassa]QDU56232.1 Rhamnogalacturonan endolyase YesW precursor [Aeoliella mucimassa]
MRNLIALLVLVAGIVGADCRAQPTNEPLTRGVVAVRCAEGGVFVSWRVLPTEVEATKFNLFRRTSEQPWQQVNDQPLAGASCWVDESAPDAEGLEYQVRVEGASDNANDDPVAKVWSPGYLEIPIQPIDGYRPGDASLGDLDGDGEFEIVLHQVSRARDNGSAGVTGIPVLDAYKLDGTHLWRISLGKNIREGEHYTQFMVYDLDGDGCAEIACKTADGTIDGQGQVIGDADKDWRTLDEGSNRDGRILDGPEYFTIFAGPTGAELKTVDFVPGRDPINGWGGIGGNAGNDSYGNRCDRFLACVAYLDGTHPSVVMCRGVYGRIVMTAWDWRDDQLTQRWKFDTGSSYPPFRDASPYAGMGGHNLSVGDVDHDGKDEIVYQAMVVDDNGQGLYSSGLRHGDVMYLSDLDPTHPGQEVFTVQENEEQVERFMTPGAAFRDAATGEILWSHSPMIDVPSCMAADIDPRYVGFECWGGPGGLRTCQGVEIGRAPRNTSWTIWWDGDPLRELLTLGRAGRRGLRRTYGDFPTQISKWDWNSEQEQPLQQLEGVSMSRGPCLVGDLLGDWREELLLVVPDGKSLRLYSTTIPTELRLPTLLADRQYRLGLVWQNVVYNRGCYPSYYLGAGKDESLNSAPQEP